MIDLTVRTLDSQSHKFSVDDEYTVLQFKEHIASTVNIPAETQRIIYSGRVLTDDSKLSELDVNGKVVHLVERPPPSDNQSNDQSNQGSNLPSMHPQPQRVMGGNAMYLGSMAIPFEHQNIVPPPPTFRLAASRLAVARRMLRRAEATIAWLENPSAPRAPPTPNDDVQVEVTPVFEARVIVPASSGEHLDENLMNAVHSSLLNNATSQVAESSSQDGSADGEGGQSAGFTPEGVSTPLSASNEDLAGVPPAAGGQTAANNASQENISRTSEMAELLELLGRLQQRFAPFLERYQAFMRDDPVVEPSSARATDRTFTRISEVLHYFSHAYHSLSDMILRVRSEPPRRLVCRPILIQQTAVVPAGFPIQVEAQINFSDVPMPANSATSGTQTQTSTTTATVTTASNSSNGSNGTARTSIVTIPNIDFMNMPPGLQPSAVHVQSIPIGIRTLRGNVGQRRMPPTPAQPAAANGNPPPNANPNVEFFMEVTPESITIDSLDPSLVGAEGGVRATAGSIQPPPDFIQSIMQMAGQLVNRGASTSSNLGPPASQGTAPASAAAPAATTTTAASTTSPPTAAGADAAGAAPAQNSQARGNTQTHPTTATYTRSTPRPHVHFAQHAIQGFDPFLPCNSHHILNLRMPSARPPSTNNNQQTQPSNNNVRPPQNGGVTAVGPTHTVMNLVQGLMGSMQGLYGRRSSSQSTGAQTAATTVSNSSTESSAPTPPASTMNATNATNPPLQNVFSLFPGFPFTIGTAPPASGNNYSRGPTIAQLLQQAGDQLTSEGLFSELLLLLSHNLTISDIMLLNSGRLDPLLRIRSEIRTFVTDRVLEGNAPTPPNIVRAINNILTEMQPFLDCLSNLQVKDNIDIVRSTQMLLRIRLPSLISLAASRRPNSMKSLVDQLKLIGRHLCGLILFASSNGQPGVEDVVNRLAASYMEGIASDLQQWTQMTTRAQLHEFLTTIDVPSSALQQYIVRNFDSLLATSSEREGNEPMEVDGEQPTTEEEAVSNVLGVIDFRDREDIPAVVIGSESWHGQVPPDWVPIIARDTQRQRRQSQPLSDSYLSGMPSKRRKVVTNNKPQGTLPQVIKESIRRAVTSTGHAPVANLDAVAEEASADLTIQSAYRDLLRTSVQTSIEDNADFTPERFPNASSYFSKSQ